MQQRSRKPLETSGSTRWARSLSALWVERAEVLPLLLLCLQDLPVTSLSHITVCVVLTQPAHTKHDLWAQCSPILTIFL